MKKTGECFYRDESGRLWLAVSYEDHHGVVTTQDLLVDGAWTLDHNVVSVEEDTQHYLNPSSISLQQDESNHPQSDGGNSFGFFKRILNLFIR